MSKTCKKLLASALAATMLFSTFVSSLVVSADEATAKTGTLVIGTDTITVGDPTAEVEFTLAFDAATTAPHSLCTITTDPALELSDLTLGEVAYVTSATDDSAAEGDDEITTETGKIEINTDGENLTAGKVLFESTAVDSTAPVVTSIKFTATFNTSSAVAGTYTVNAITDATDVDESDSAITVTPGSIVIEEAAAECEHTNATLEYTVVDGSCVTTKVCECGYEEVIATVAAERAGQDTGLRIYRAPILDSGLALAFRTLTASSADYTDVYGVFTKDVYVRDGGNTLTDPEVTTIKAVIDPDYEGKRYKFLYEGIRSYEMCSNINIKIFGTNSDGYVCFLGTLDYTFASYIQNNYSAATGTLKTLLGDLAFYGAAAQDYFEYRYESKPNAGIEDEHTVLPTTFDTTDNLMEGGITISKAPDLANKVLINFRFNQSDVADYGEDLRFEVDYIDAEGNSATFVKNFDEFEIYNETRYQVVFDALVAARINDVVTAKVITGENTVVGQLEYTLEKYAYNRYSGTDNGEPLCILTQALVNYGDAAAAYFG